MQVPPTSKFLANFSAAFYKLGGNYNWKVANDTLQAKTTENPFQQSFTYRETKNYKLKDQRNSTFL